MNRVLLLLPLILACNRGAEAGETEIAFAALRDVELDSFAFLVGGSGGSATLELTSSEGQGWSIPVDLRGTMAGLAFQFSFVDIGDPGVVLEFEDTVTVDQLFAPYTGMGMDFVLGVGIDTRQLSNRHDVQLGAGWFAVGASIWVGWERLRIALPDGVELADAMASTAVSDPS